MRRQTHQRAIADDPAHVGGRQIVLAHVHAAGAGEPRDVRAIVDDDRDALIPGGSRDDGLGPGEAVASWRFLGPNLKERGSAVEARRGEVDQRPAGLPAGAGVADRVEGRVD
jgi:hypothetical protein